MRRGDLAHCVVATRLGLPRQRPGRREMEGVVGFQFDRGTRDPPSIGTHIGETQWRHRRRGGRVGRNAHRVQLRSSFLPPQNRGRASGRVAWTRDDRMRVVSAGSTRPRRSTCRARIVLMRPLRARRFPLPLPLRSPRVRSSPRVPCLPGRARSLCLFSPHLGRHDILLRKNLESPFDGARVDVKGIVVREPRAPAVARRRRSVSSLERTTVP